MSTKGRPRIGGFVKFKGKKALTAEYKQNLL